MATVPAPHRSSKVPPEYLAAKTGRQYRFHVAEDLLRLDVGATASRPVNTQTLMTLYEGVERVALYAHIPWCVETCTYCYYWGKVEPRSAMEELLKAEKRHAGLLDERIALHRKTCASIYFGGGTPTVLPPDLLRLVMRNFVEHYAIYGSTEVCSEASVSSLTPEKIAILEPFVTRLSIGIQSFNDRLLSSVARSFSAIQAKKLLEAIIPRFRCINIDLIYGMQHQSQDDWIGTIDEAIQLGVQSVTLYRLEIRVPKLISEFEAEPHTFPAEQTCQEMRQCAKDRLLASGYRENLVGWFVRPEAVDTVVYRERWQKQTPCVAFGPGVHNYGRDYFYYNEHSPASYMEMLSQNTIPATRLVMLEPRQQLLWYVLAQWKSNAVVRVADITERFGDPLVTEFRVILRRFEDWELLCLNDVDWAVSPEGKGLLEWILRDIMRAWLGVRGSLLEAYAS